MCHQGSLLNAAERGIAPGLGPVPVGQKQVGWAEGCQAVCRKPSRDWMSEGCGASSGKGAAIVAGAVAMDPLPSTDCSEVLSGGRLLRYEVGLWVGVCLFFFFFFFW